MEWNAKLDKLRVDLGDLSNWVYREKRGGMEPGAEIS